MAPSVNWADPVWHVDLYNNYITQKGVSYERLSSGGDCRDDGSADRGLCGIVYGEETLAASSIHWQIMP